MYYKNEREERNMLSIKQIKYAIAVEKTLHFKNAAKLCNISQSTLSSAITEMEKNLNVNMFERGNKKVLITPIGKKILEKAKIINMELDDICQLVRSSRAPLGYPVSLGVIPTIGPYLLPKVLPAVRSLYPNLEITIIEEQSAILINMVREGTLDTAIIALPFATPGLHQFKFWQENFMLIMHKDNPLSKNKVLRTDLLSENNLLLLKEGHCLTEHTLAACKLSSKQNNQIMLSGTGLYTLIQMVACKMGVTFVPAMAVKQLTKENSELSVISLDEPGPHRAIAFITRLNYSGTNNIEILKSIFINELHNGL